MKDNEVSRRVIGNIVAMKEGVGQDFECGNVFSFNGKAAVRFERVGNDGVRVGRNFTVFTEIPFQPHP